ncbi:MAG: serine hydrolase [Verrucomicrobiaceae bacterium]|nr:serine hydrolase [Verrucomicrobiaceae bacterium]
MRGFALLTLLLWQAAALAFVPDTAAPLLRADDLTAIDNAAQAQVRAGKIPGAVVLVGNGDRVLYRKAFGYRTKQPKKIAMTTDTLFDLASLTKVIATTTAVMQLVENQQLQLDDPIAKYWPEFAANGKAAITVRQALTHYTGLRPDLPTNNWSGYNTALAMIAAEQPQREPGSAYEYSDINFEILGELVQRISGQPLDIYCLQHIFQPLGMRDTGFKPIAAVHERIAPTVYWRKKIIWGQVNDPTAFAMGGIAGHAGLFSSADDLAIFARMLLHGGSYRDAQILKPETVAQITSPQALPDKTRQRGLGWNLEAPNDRGNTVIPRGFYGHTGYTGTSLWIDPITRTYVIILTNRVFPNDTGDVGPLRNQIADVVGSAIDAGVQRFAGAKTMIGNQTTPIVKDNARVSNDITKARNSNIVRSGLDMLASEQFAPLAGKRIGLITNQSGRDAQGRHAIELLQQTPGVQLVALFSPEHGLRGNLDEKIASGIDSKTGLPVYSLYGKNLRPTPEMLQGIDALVFDIQDAGVRFYTYITTLAYTMEAASAADIDFYVLDRPNPINAETVQGPMLDNAIRSFTAYYALPIRYGMTPGELALMYNGENHIGVKLHVIKMSGYQRDSWYDQTGLTWVNPSPNLRSLEQTALYPGVALIEGANVSVGRGTASPFEVFGAPWIDSKKLLAYLEKRKVAGVHFLATSFTPIESNYHHQRCQGVRIVLDNRNKLDAPALGVEIASALHQLYPKQFRLGDTLGMIGARATLNAIRDGEDPHSIVASWRDPLDNFRLLRAKYLLY